MLVTNDDGINAPGLRALVDALVGMGFNVYVAAPLYNKSSTGKSIRLPARVGEASIPGTVKAWWIDSTPATAVLLAIYGLMDEPPDLVVSGINKGPNMGFEDLLTSGTVGAALEASLHGVPAVAASLATDEQVGIEGYVGVARFTALLGRHVAGRCRGAFLNINSPLRPRGVLVTRPAFNNYRPNLVFHDGVAYVTSSSYRMRYWDERVGTDVWAVLRGYISVTPISVDGMYKGSPHNAEWLKEVLDEVWASL
ncbi:MAG: 5'/3'-nucleotidase SurE [Desulfurococcales archaeon]|nr:5'/3'-nucleotidase SurE [Desulfurococcales archaeon]